MMIVRLEAVVIRPTSCTNGKVKPGTDGTGADKNFNPSEILQQHFMVSREVLPNLNSKLHFS
jgi:hypothetical protein